MADYNSSLISNITTTFVNLTTTYLPIFSNDGNSSSTAITTITPTDNNYYNTTTTIGNNRTNITTTTVPPEKPSACCECRQFLEDDLGESGVKYWDTALLCPQILFLVFLLIKLRPSIGKLMRSRSPLILLMYVLVWTDTIVAVIRAVAAVAMRSGVERGDQILWICLNFFFVATETAVLAFGVLFGHLDSAKGVRRVMFAAIGVASVSTAIMATLEFKTLPAPPTSFHHGTMPFFAVSTAVFLLVYIFTLALPCSPWRDRFLLPSKRSFYVYCGVFVALDSVQLLGTCLVLGGVSTGYCLLTATVFIYMTLVPVAVYFVYLRSFFARPVLGIPFSFDDPAGSVSINNDGDAASLPSTPYSFTRQLTIQFDTANNNDFANINGADAAFMQPSSSTKPVSVPPPNGQQQHFLESNLPSMSL